MASHKVQRATAEIQKELSDLLRTLKDPRLDGAMLSIVNVDLSNDMSHCTVYVSSLEGMEKTKEAVEGLRSAQGFIRREIGNRIRLRRLPEFHFVADDGIEYSANIGKVLDQINRKNKGDADED